MFQRYLLAFLLYCFISKTAASCVDSWSSWINYNHPSSSNLNDTEKLEGCTGGAVTDVDCQTTNGSHHWASGQTNIICNVTHGLQCLGIYNPSGCFDYKMKYFCKCGLTSFGPNDTVVSSSPMASNISTTYRTTLSPNRPTSTSSKLSDPATSPSQSSSPRTVSTNPTERATVVSNSLMASSVSSSYRATLLTNTPTSTSSKLSDPSASQSQSSSARTASTNPSFSPKNTESAARATDVTTFATNMHSSSTMKIPTQSSPHHGASNTEYTDKSSDRNSANTLGRPFIWLPTVTAAVLVINTFYQIPKYPDCVLRGPR